jgi:transposase-like protein
VKGVWKYLYRAIDKADTTVNFLLTAKRDRKAASRFLRKAIEHNGTPKEITIDKSGANPRRSNVVIRAVTLALRSVGSNTSTTSLSRIVGPSND